ncbi:MAG TPA: hypothetical protein PKA64_23585, partial [Myxococcota bacterium]|nr:hypothetical protein [Myxococcota bacterium]
DHHLTWTLAWASRPNGLPLPTGTALVDLTLDGQPVIFPLVDAAGLLRLGARDSDGPGENRLTLEVSRRVDDGVPLRVSTHIELRASGTAREVALGQVIVPGTLPYAVTADLPARLMPDGALTVQLRPGTFHVDVDAVAPGPVTKLAAPELPAPWPDHEVWAVHTDDPVRMVDLSGPPGVDPARTTLPEAWRGLPAFVVSPATPLEIAELRRGEPDPAPNAVQLDRELWLDLDGAGMTVRDTFSGSISQGWRLDVLPPTELGHASDHGDDVVITTRDGAVGVELRDTSLSLVAEGRLAGRALPAVGWAQDVQQLGVQLHLPPGWTLAWASGVDALDGPDPSWTLFDLFYVLVLGLALSRLLGRRWGALALVALALARHVQGAPSATWVALTVLLALGRVAAPGWAQVGVTWARRGTLLLLFGLLAPLVYAQVQGGLYPQLAERGWRSYDSYDKMASYEPILARGGSERKMEIQGSDGWSRGQLTKVDPNAVVQTGPGIPTWTWDTWQLRWSGPVARDQELRLWLLGPTANLLLALVRSGLLLALALEITRRERRAAALLALLILLPGRSLAAPDGLDELQARLAAPPACGDQCATAASTELTVEGDTLTVDVEVHAAALTSWPLPGPAEAWVPRRVELDG